MWLNSVKRKLNFSKFTKMFTHFSPRAAGRRRVLVAYVDSWQGARRKAKNFLHLGYSDRKINDFYVGCINILVIFQSDSTLFLLSIIKIIQEWWVVINFLFENVGGGVKKMKVIPLQLYVVSHKSRSVSMSFYFLKQSRR